MKLLLDTHALLWWLSDSPRLGPIVRFAIADPENEVLVSVVSLWEIVVKSRIGKLGADIDAVEQAIVRDGFGRLGITRGHLSALVGLVTHHRDPFDHLLIVQAMTEDAVFVSDDSRMQLYPARTIRCES